MARADPGFVRQMIVSMGAGGTLLGDSTGLSVSTAHAWQDVRGGSASRRGYDKPSVPATEDGLVVDYEADEGRRHDSPPMRAMLARLPRGSGDLVLDSAYCSRDVCRLAEAAGRRPAVRPEKSTRPRGLHAMGRMLRWRAEDPEGFDAACHGRSLAGSAFSSLKRAVSERLRSRRPRMRAVEIALLVLSYHTHVLRQMGALPA